MYDTDQGFLKRRPFQVDVVAVLAGLIVGTVLIVALYTYHRNSQAALAMSGALVDQVADTVIEKTTGFLAPAGEISRIVASLVPADNPNPSARPLLEAHLLSVMKSYPQFSMLYVGDERGSFLMVARQPDGTLATEIIDRTGDTPKLAWKYRDATGDVIREAPSDEIDYDPRLRSWYKGASATRGLFWTDVYVFHTGKKPGITASFPILDDTGEVRAVVGADIALDELSAFLAAQKVGQRGVPFLFDNQNRVVAYPDVSRIVRVDGDNVTLTGIDGIGAPDIARAVAMHTGHKAAEHFGFEGRDGRSLAYFTPFPPSFGKDWTIAVVVPEDDFLGPVKDAHRMSLLISGLILFVAIGFALVLARNLSRPIEELTAETVRIRDFRLDRAEPIRSHIREVQQMSDAIESMKAGLSAFRKYVPDDLVRQLIATGEEARVGGEERVLTLFVSDIQGFTTIAEKMPPQELMQHLSDYLEEMTGLIRGEGGVIDKYIGDGILAFWNAPRPCEGHATAACRAALACRDKLANLNRQWPLQGRPALPTRIAIHTSSVVVGNVGSSDRINYTVLGDGANLAARLESLNRLYGTDILVTRETQRAAEGEFLFRHVDLVAVAGRSEGVRVYELMCARDNAQAGSLATLAADFDKAVTAYQNRDWKSALKLFRDIACRYPADRPAQLYIERCGMNLSGDPGPDWTPIMRLESK